ncbi:MAG: trimethylamine--corrinoid protein Co-methyltransferase [Planctomycetota bacterium]|jgi:trimethylamine--corrinoid protein Co-methyltransferase
MRATAHVLEPELVTDIIEESLTILAETGVIVDYEPAFRFLRERGFEGDESTMRIRMSREQVREAIGQAPKSIELYDREGNLHASLGEDRVHFVPASSALKFLDDQTGEMRDPTSLDFTRYVRVADGLKNIAYLSTAFVPMDVPAGIADAWRLFLSLSHSKKPVVSGAFTADGVERIADVLRLFRSSDEELAQKPLSILTCCPNTPMRWGEDPVRNLMDCARLGIPTEIVPVLLLGMISPSTTVGAIVLHTAEVLSGLTIAQAVKPGAPVIFGGAPASFHMRLMTNPMTAVEALQVYCGYTQVAKSLSLPTQAYMALSDSKRHDAQSGMETGVGAFLAAMAGVNSVSGPGMLDYVNCFSLEKLVFDDEVAAHALHFIRPVTVKEDLPTRALIDELIEEKHLLMSEHTLEHWPKELYLPGPLIDRTNWDQWADRGEKEGTELANEVIEEVLEDYELPALDPLLHREAAKLFTRYSGEPTLDLPAY